MSDLAEFLLARIAEDEAAARAATQGRWTWVDPGVPGSDAILWALNGSQLPRSEGAVCWPPGEAVLAATYDDSGVDGSDADKEHIARWDPARVLAECEAKRRIIRWVREWPWRKEPPSSVDGLLPMLALPYADHPDYREEWRP